MRRLYNQNIYLKYFSELYSSAYPYQGRRGKLDSIPATARGIVQPGRRYNAERQTNIHTHIQTRGHLDSTINLTSHCCLTAKRSCVQLHHLPSAFLCGVLPVSACVLAGYCGHQILILDQSYVKK